ncbi:hypothetical protein [Falsirhodobacter sp. 20TX0035]|uniref:hypothetical protein n=1 Tax=Falsirhodobacter sp. 20TX0035 TaxID=3022019 RepID=UPI00232BFE36|nr:hypothetical protein [Falsirhodobacter sp. 20TX0035]MDB6454458.1 hypothetical protein [Falsirhodobacter sp. 20TX0035]
MKTLLFRLSAIAFLCLALPGGYLADLQIRGNFHPVEQGVAYRSAQPSAEDSARWTHRAGLRSVINLRAARMKARRGTTKRSPPRTILALRITTSPCRRASGWGRRKRHR